MVSINKGSESFKSLLEANSATFEGMFSVEEVKEVVWSCGSNKLRGCFLVMVLWLL